MESSGHFIFELIKITILGFIYSTIFFFIYSQIPKNKKPEWSEKWLNSKNTIWAYTSLLLLFYMFTPYGNHGLGDGARIPVSFTTTISNINWNEYGLLDGIETCEGNKIETTQFKVQNDMICGNLNSGFYEYKNSYFIYDLDTEKLKEFETAYDYNNFAKIKNLPETTDLKSFKENYSEYWSGWRFFLLP